MRAEKIILVQILLSIVHVTTAAKCQRICADVKKAVSFKSSCSSYRNVLPKPKVEWSPREVLHSRSGTRSKCCQKMDFFQSALVLVLTFTLQRITEIKPPTTFFFRLQGTANEDSMQLWRRTAWMRA